MKTHQLSKTILLAYLSLMAFALKAQDSNAPKKLELAFNKTSSIVFPSAIKNVDRGSRDVLAQKAKGADNVLQLKAARENFPETNLTVITAEGNLHHFTVNYCAEPATLTMMVKDSLQSESNRRAVNFETDLTEADMEKYASIIKDSKRSIHFIGKNNFKVNVSLLGIYIKDNVMFFHLRVKNHSNIHYDIDFLRFYVRDKSKMKRTASQELQITPLYISGNNHTVKAQSMSDLVYAVEKFTIPEAKNLHIEMFEHRGGRNFNLTVKNKSIVRAKPLP